MVDTALPHSATQTPRPRPRPAHRTAESDAPALDVSAAPASSTPPVAVAPVRVTPPMPATPVLAKQTYSSTMSYVGITRRTTAWVRQVGSAGPVALAFAIIAAVFFLAFMYAFVTCWYFVVSFLFGWLFFPFRLMRRGQRKQEALQRQQLATMQAMLAEQRQQFGATPPQ